MATQVRDASVETLEASQPSLLDRAKQNDHEAIAIMFRQYLPRDEQVIVSEYLGVLGVWGVGTHSFAAVTDRRVAGMQVRILGGVTYQDGFLEFLNSGVVHQPSKLLLYLYVAAISILTLGIGLLLLPLTVRMYYRFKKCGLVLWVREGVPVYVFSDRKRIGVANNLYREAAHLREELLSATGRSTETAASRVRAVRSASAAGGASSGPVDVEGTGGSILNGGGSSPDTQRLAVEPRGGPLAWLVLVGLGLLIAIILLIVTRSSGSDESQEVLDNGEDALVVPTESTMPEGFAFRINGTCALGPSCSVLAYSGPGTSYPQKGSVDEGEIVQVVCQAKGQPIRSGDSRGTPSDVWNRLSDGRWVSDVFVLTGLDGFHPEVPRCT
jgi:hypothetical protein